MTELDVGPSDEVVLQVRLDQARASELRRWAMIGRRSMEEAAVAAIDEYIHPIETAAHGCVPQPFCPVHGGKPS